MSLKVSHLAPAQRREQLAELEGGEVFAFGSLPLRIVSTNEGSLVVPTLDAGVTRSTPGDGAAIEVWSASDADSLVWIRHRTDELSGERGLGVDQTNESVILGERAVLKWCLFASRSVSAEKEQLLHDAGFRFTPDLWGHLWWRADTAQPERLLASVTEYIPNTEDGWTWAPQALVHDDIAWAARLGEIAAEMHSALRVGRTDQYVEDQAPIPELKGASTQLIHGDFHLGQVLRNGESLYVIDFDGDPLKTDAENAECQSVWLDVASMSCSIIHAGMVAIKRGADSSQIYAAISQARSEFLVAYIAASGLPLAADVFERLVDRVEERELAYASQYLPRWLYAPEGAIEYLRTVRGR